MKQSIKIFGLDVVNPYTPDSRATLDVIVRASGPMIPGLYDFVQETCKTFHTKGATAATITSLLGVNIRDKFEPDSVEVEAVLNFSGDSPDSTDEAEDIFYR